MCQKHSRRNAEEVCRNSLCANCQILYASLAIVRLNRKKLSVFGRERGGICLSNNDARANKGLCLACNCTPATVTFEKERYTAKIVNTHRRVGADSPSRRHTLPKGLLLEPGNNGTESMPKLPVVAPALSHTQPPHTTICRTNREGIEAFLSL